MPEKYLHLWKWEPVLCSSPFLREIALNPTFRLRGQAPAQKCLRQLPLQ